MMLLFMLLIALMIGYVIFCAFGAVGILLTMLLCSVGVIAFLIFILKKVKCIVIHKTSKKD